MWASPSAWKQRRKALNDFFASSIIPGLRDHLMIVFICIVVNAPLINHPNCAGMYQCLLIINLTFLIFNQASLHLPNFPIVVLFGAKNSLLSLLLGPGSGYICCWSGWYLVLGGFIHGSLWICNHLQYNIPIIRQQKETQELLVLALLALSCLAHWCLLGNKFYQTFFIIQSVSILLLGPISVDFKTLKTQLQHSGIHLIFHYHLLPYNICLTLNLLSSGSLWSRCSFVHVPISHQECYIDIHQ